MNGIANFKFYEVITQYYIIHEVFLVHSSIIMLLKSSFTCNSLYFLHREEYLHLLL